MRLDSKPATVFQDSTVPASSKLAGWSALVHALGVDAPVRNPCCVSEQHVRGSHRLHGEWALFDKRYWPGDSFADHLTFALRHENLDLLILKRVFEAVPQAEIEAFVEAAPIGIPARRTWYLYELLMDKKLGVDDAPNAAAIDLLDPKFYFTGKARSSKRHRVRDNLLGNAEPPKIRPYSTSDSALKGEKWVPVATKLLRSVWSSSPRKRGSRATA